MAVVLESYVEHFDQNFDKIKDLMYQQIPKEYPNYMKVESLNKAFAKRSYMGGLGMPKRNRDLENIPMDQPPKGPTAYFEPTNYRLGYQIERQTVEDEMWGLLASRPQKMLYGASILIDMTCADILNNGTVLQSYDFGGKPLFATDHLREDGMATWSNRIAQNLPITVETVFSAIVDLLYHIPDTNGFPIAYNGSYNLYVPSINAKLWQQAVEVANSVMNPNTSDNKINALNASSFKINVVPLRFLTNADHWFIGWDTSLPDYGLVCMMRQEPEISPLQPFGGNPDAYFSRLRMRFVAGYDNKRGIAQVGA